MTFIRQLRARRLQSAIEEQREFYAASWKPEEIRAWQLQQFNQSWPTISQRVPFYTALVRDGKAPRRFGSWEEFRSTVPITDRAFVQRHGQELYDASRSSDFTRTTGGSTSQPVQLPAWRSELDCANGDLWFARNWFGISSADKLFLFWGHSHQLGRGVRGKMNALRRELKDALLGYRRWSAYDLSEPALRRAGEELLRFRPAWIIAYSVALDRFARANADRATEFRALNLKAAIATAEAFPRSDSAAFITSVLGCPVVMEYGSVECGPVAHQKSVVGSQWSVVSGQSAPQHPLAKDRRPQTTDHGPKIIDAPPTVPPPFQILWRHWFVEGIPATHVPGTFEIFLTSLYPRCFPLVRYRIGDLISEDPNAPDFDQTFKRVIGRCNDYVTLPDGRSIHSEAFTHAIKDCSSVLNFQVVQANGKIDFRYISTANGKTDEAEIRRRLSTIDLALSTVELKRVDALPQTVAGKTRSIVHEEIVP